MAFFSKLKERLFKSSSKLDEGLEAIVSEGGEEETAAPEAERETPPEPVTETTDEAPARDVAGLASGPARIQPSSPSIRK